MTFDKGSGLYVEFIPADRLPKQPGKFLGMIVTAANQDQLKYKVSKLAAISRSSFFKV